MTKTILTLVLLTLAVPAYAGRWKVGTPVPAGVETRLAINEKSGGTILCWKSTESGPDQCRWKTNNGCKWTYDGGSTNQCSPNPTIPPATASDPWGKPVTFTGTKGTVKMTPYKVDGAGRMFVQFEAVLNFTGEHVRGEVQWYNPVGSRDVRLISHRVYGMDYTNQLVLRGASGTRTPIYLSASTPGVPPPSWVPQPPGSLPPTGESCYYAWSTFQAQQMNCIASHMSSFWSNAWRSAITDATVGSFTCAPAGIAANELAGPYVAATVYAACIGGLVSKPFADYMVDGIFWGRGIIDQAGGIPPACTADEFARVRLSQACGTTLP
jgi:hypothetical protein